MTVAATLQIEFLEQERDALLVERATLQRRLKFFEDNRLVWERGGWEAVVALRDRRIHGLKLQIETERADARRYRNRLNSGRIRPSGLVMSPNLKCPPRRTNRGGASDQHS